MVHASSILEGLDPGFLPDQHMHKCGPRSLVGEVAIATGQTWQQHMATPSWHVRAGVGGALWRQGYSVEDELRPPMVSRTLADKLLRAGKSLNFLRRDCLPAHVPTPACCPACSSPAVQLFP